jgi:hypothetical protein
MKAAAAQGTATKRNRGRKESYIRDHALLPTLTATTNKRGYSGQAERSLLCQGHAGGPINPEWCEHLMAFPIGWSELPD